jgi:hypothetical protein
MEGENEAKDWLICRFVNSNMINVMTKYGAPMICQGFVITFISVSLISIAIQSRLTIFDPHNDDRGLHIS